MKKVNVTTMPVPSKPGPKIISYDQLEKSVGGAKKSEGSGVFKGELKKPGK